MEVPLFDNSPRLVQSVRALPPDPLQPGVLARVLDEIDHGLLLIDLTGRILHSNHLASRELVAARALCDAGGMLEASRRGSQARIRQALRDAERGCRSIVELEDEMQPLSLAFIPLEPRAPGAALDTVLVICSRAVGCESLTMQMFARARQLTCAEQGVLSQLCAGRRAREIACLQGICVSTVRTHIKNVRQKTGSSSIREVVQRVSRMPQIVSALRKF